MIYDRSQFTRGSFLVKHSVGQVIENKTIVTLPLNGRNYSQIVALMPGSTPNQGARASDGVSLNGDRTFQNTYLKRNTICSKARCGRFTATGLISIANFCNRAANTTVKYRKIIWRLFAFVCAFTPTFITRHEPGQ